MRGGSRVCLLDGANMLKIKDIEKNIYDDTLDTIFKVREELYSKKEKSDDAEIKSIKEDYSVEYDRLLVAINNLLPHFNNTREGITGALESYLTRENLIMAHNNEKFYKIGFCDGIRTILENIKSSR